MAGGTRRKAQRVLDTVCCECARQVPPDEVARFRGRLFCAACERKWSREFREDETGDYNPGSHYDAARVPDVCRPMS